MSAVSLGGHSPARCKTCNNLTRLATNNVIITRNCQLYCRLYLQICAVGNPYAIEGEIAIIILFANGTLRAMPNEFANLKPKGL